MFLRASFAHAEGWQWTPDLIWFDNLNSYGTPNYYVQKLFSLNRGTHLLDILKDGKPLTGQNGLYATAALDNNAGVIILKIVNTTDKPQVQNMVLQTAKKILPGAKMTVLSGDQLSSVNSLTQKENVAPVDQEITLKGKKLAMTCKPYSLSVIRIKQK